VRDAQLFNEIIETMIALSWKTTQVLQTAYWVCAYGQLKAFVTLHDDWIFFSRFVGMMRKLLPLVTFEKQCNLSPTVM